jgi:hypothetical protein
MLELAVNNFQRKAAEVAKGRKALVDPEGMKNSISISFEEFIRIYIYEFMVHASG